jgi:hypothetical protein
MVAGGHMTGAPVMMTYASVVSRETNRIALTIAALNDLEVKVANILNASILPQLRRKTRIGSQHRQVCFYHPCTLWTEKCQRSIPCSLGGFHAAPWLHVLSCQPGPVVQRGALTRNWGMLLLLHLDLR